MSISFAKRIAQTDISGIRKVFDLAQKLENPVNLSIGQPDFAVPEAVTRAAIEGINSGKNGYTPTQGAPAARKAILEHLGGEYSSQEMLITSAVSGGLLLSFLSILDPGDEILIPEPYFVMYKQLAIMLGATPVYYDTYPSWKVSAESIKAQITDKTKAIVIGSPSNPTGAVYSDEDMKELAKVAKEKDLLIISDEIYKDFCYDAPFVSISKHYKNTLCLRGFSKSHAITGWRMGYAVGPADLIQAMTKLQQFTFVCAPSMAQEAAIVALDTDISQHVNDYAQKRDLIYNGLKDIGYDVEKPGGAFYIFPKVPWSDDMGFVSQCIDNNLLVIPGSVFSEKHTHFRISYAAADDTIKRGLDILAKLYKSGE